MLSNSQVSKKQRDLISIAKVCGEQLLVVINDILGTGVLHNCFFKKKYFQDISVSEQGNLILVEDQVPLRTTVEQSADAMAFEVAGKSMEFIVDVDPNVPETIIGDAARIRQLLINLLGNALKFSSEGEVVLRVVKTEEKESEKGTLCTIQFSVQDSGVGIQDDIKEVIFQPFMQADSSPTRRFVSVALFCKIDWLSQGGSGMGLCISKRLAGFSLH